MNRRRLLLGVVSAAGAAVAAALVVRACLFYPGHEIGSTGGKPVHTGFVFYDGRYLDSPYTVSRKGLNVRINGTVVFTWAHWPPPKRTRVDEDPGMPEGLDENSTFEDLRQSGHGGRKWAYLRQHFPVEEAMDGMADYYRALPFVESVVRKEPACPDLLVVVTTKSGKAHNIGFLRCWEPLTEEIVTQRLEYQRSYLERRLADGGCVFLFSNGQELSYGRHWVAENLKVTVEILRSDRPREEKLDLLHRLGMTPEPRAELFAALVDRFHASRRLDERLEALLSDSGKKPRTIGDIPLESQVQMERRAAEERERRMREAETRKNGNM